MTPAQPAILILESEPLIAMDVEDMLTAAGFERVTHVAAARDAIALIESQASLVVILDLFALDGSTAWFAEILSKKGVASIVYSGLQPCEVEPPFPLGDGIWLSKPCNASDLVGAIRAVSGLAE